MPKIAKTARPSVLFNPLTSTGHCQFCKLVQPYPCEDPECLALKAEADKKSAESFADNALKVPPKPRRRYRKKQNHAIETITTQEQVRAHVDEYIKILEKIMENPQSDHRELAPEVSVQFGAKLCPRDTVKVKQLKHLIENFHYYHHKGWVGDYIEEFHANVWNIVKLVQVPTVPAEPFPVPEMDAHTDAI